MIFGSLRTTKLPLNLALGMELFYCKLSSAFQIYLKWAYLARQPVNALKSSTIINKDTRITKLNQTVMFLRGNYTSQSPSVSESTSASEYSADSKVPNVSCVNSYIYHSTPVVLLIFIKTCISFNIKISNSVTCKFKLYKLPLYHKSVTLTWYVGQFLWIQLMRKAFN